MLSCMKFIIEYFDKWLNLPNNVMMPGQILEALVIDLTENNTSYLNKTKTKFLKSIWYEDEKTS